MPGLQSLKIERPKSLSEIAADNIREAIIRGDFHLGEPLTENALSNRLGISKTPVREALASLKQEGLLSGDSQKGARVFTLTAVQLRQLCAYRYTLEAAALDLAVACDLKGLTQALKRVCRQMKDANKQEDFTKYVELDRDFHDVFFDYAENQFLKEGYRCVSQKVSTLRTYLSRGPMRIEKSYAEHLEITALLGRGQIDAAKKVLHEQIDRGSGAIDELLMQNA